MERLTQQTAIEVGQKFPLTIKRLGINGEGVGFYKRNVIFVKGAIPGEEITAQVTKTQRNFAEAEILTIRKTSKYRQEAPCSIYNECGGCQLQHMTYEKQLIEKRDIVIQALERYAKPLAETVEVRKTLVWIIHGTIVTKVNSKYEKKANVCMQGFSQKVATNYSILMIVWFNTPSHRKLQSQHVKFCRS